MRLPAAGCHVPVDRRQRMGESAVNFSRHDAARHEVTTARCSHCAVIPSPQCTMSTLFWIRAVRTGVALCSGQVFSSALLLASRSGLQRISFTIGVSGWHSLPDFRPRSVKDSGALRRSGATGTNFGTYCIISSRPCSAKRKSHFGPLDWGSIYTRPTWPAKMRARA